MNFSIPDCNSKSVTLRGVGDGGRDSNNPFHSEITERRGTGSGGDGVNLCQPIWHCVLDLWLRVLITH